MYSLSTGRSPFVRNLLVVTSAWPLLDAQTRITRVPFPPVSRPNIQHNSKYSSLTVVYPILYSGL